MHRTLPRPRRTPALLVAAVAALATGSLASRTAVAPPHRGTAATPVTPLVLPDGRTITPPGLMVTAGDFIGDAALDTRVLVASNPAPTLYTAAAGEASAQPLSSIDALSLQYSAVVPVKPGASPSQAKQSGSLALSPDGLTLYSSGASDHDVLVFSAGRPALQQTATIPTPAYAGDIALNAAGTALYVTEPQDTAQRPWQKGSRVDRIDLATKVTTTASVGFHPLPVRALTTPGVGAREVVAVGNEDDGTVSILDALTLARVATVPVGRHPSNLAVVPGGAHLLVVCSLDDALYDIDTATWTAGAPLSLSSPVGPGATPDAIAVSADGSTAYVALAKDNAVAVVARAGGRMSIAGRIPTAWYPTALQIDEANHNLLVAAAKGLDLDPYTPPGAIVTSTGRPTVPVSNAGRGTSAVIEQIPLPDAATLATYSQQVAANNGWAPAASGSTPLQCPPAAIQHVVLIVRENKTFDQELGDDARAGSAAFSQYTTYGQAITPNIHALADRYNLLTAFYDDEEVSDIGHEALNGAVTNDWTERLTFQSYGGASDVGYDIEDPDANGNNGNGDGIQWSTSNYILDDAAAHQVSFKDYGNFFRQSQTVKGVAADPRLEPGIVRGAPGFGFDLDVADTARAAYWKADYLKDVAAGNVPALEVVYLPLDHTGGSAAGGTKNGQVADNDAATGQIVDTLSHSPYWGNTAVFVEEDDPQSGLDHVDEHRSIGLLVSPWSTPQTVSAQHYDQASILRTIEIMLGLPALTEVDATAAPMTDLLDSTPHLDAYTRQTATPAVDPVRQAATRALQDRLAGPSPDWGHLPADVQRQLAWFEATGTTVDAAPTPPATMRLAALAAQRHATVPAAPPSACPRTLHAEPVPVGTTGSPGGGGNPGGGNPGGGGGSPGSGNPGGGATTGNAPGSDPCASRPQGYWLVASDGGVFPFGGGAPGYGSTGGVQLNRPIVGMAARCDASGYWLVASDGGIFPFGSGAPGYGSTGGIRLNQPVVGMAAVPDGSGYWLVAADGGIFPFGPGAGGFGSTGALRLNRPIVGMAPTASGSGYWLVAADGGVFPFGDALQHSYGSTGGMVLNQPIVGMAPTASGNGYWLVAADGGIFPFGDALQHSYGSTGGMVLNQPIVSMAGAADGNGYWLTAADGGVFPFGPSARGLGSTGGQRLNRPVVGMAAAG